MIVTRFMKRFFSSGNLAAEKSLLASLRKKTGYTFANCKKALEMHNNDIVKAEGWLRDQAQALGWSKATKLGGRATSQGLIGVALNTNNGVLVEVNCETDFVARNKEFQKIVEQTTSTCLDFSATQQQQQNKPITKSILSSEQLRALTASDGKSLSDHLALFIGTCGENATLNRAQCIRTNDKNINLFGYAHPAGLAAKDVVVGKIAGIVALRSKTEGAAIDEKIGKNLCQHIVGMRPTKIGSAEDKPAACKEDEVALIHQEYVLDDSMTVQEYLDEHGVEVVDFKRFECGEKSPVVSEQNIEFVETCQ